MAGGEGEPDRAEAHRLLSPRCISSPCISVMDGVPMKPATNVLAGRL